MKAERLWIIYVLKDPRTGEVRYVGVTHHGRDRLAGHIYSVKRRHTHTTSWIKSLLKLGLKPLMEVIEEGKGADWATKERFWIAEYRQRAARLTNHTEGGEGTLGWSPSIEQRAKMSERARGVNLGRKYTPEAKANMSRAQKAYQARLRVSGEPVKRGPRSLETIRKMSEAQRGRKHSEASRQKMAESSRKRNLTPELRQAFAKGTASRSPEWKAWFAQNQKGKPKSAETRVKMSGKPKSAETKAKISESVRMSESAKTSALEQLTRKILGYHKENGKRPVRGVSKEWENINDWLRRHKRKTLFQYCQDLGLA